MDSKSLKRAALDVFSPLHESKKKKKKKIRMELYPSENDLPYEEELLRNPFGLKLWWRYLVARADAPFKKRAIIYERALKALPGSYKLWHAYLSERLQLVRNLPVTDSQFQTLNNTFERALVTMHKMPRIWIMYLQTLTEQKLLTRTRRTFDRALCALPVTQHDRIWAPYLYFVTQTQRFPIQTSLRVYRRYLKYDPSQIEDFIEFLVDSELWQEAAERLAGVLNDDQFCSIKGKTKHRLWLELCDLLTQHATGLNVDAIIRGGIRKFTDEVGMLWTSLADYYIRRKLVEKARDIFEEGMATVVTVRDFSVIFDAYSQFEESMLALKMEEMSESDDEVEEEDEDLEDEDDRLNVAKLEKNLKNFWLNDDKDVDLRLARLEYLMDRRPELANSVLLRQNPHNVEQWHRRVKLFEGNPTRQILTYTEAVKTIDPMKAVGKPLHTLWVAFAKLYEKHKDVANARVIFDKAVQVNYKTVDHLAAVWCEWVEMELRHKNFKHALQLMRCATAEPSVEVKRRVVAAADGIVNEPVQMRLHKSLRLWTFYVDLEESLQEGTLESTKAVYERILDLKIATPQIIINYAMLLEDHKFFEESFKIYERGVKIFKYPHVKDIWTAYLSKFVQRYGKSKLERARELFDHAVKVAPADVVKPLFLQYAKLEEDYGLAKRAMMVYDQATVVVPANEKLSIYEIYLARASEIFGIPKTREIYERAINNSGLPDKDVKTMCLKYAELEKSLGEIDRARVLYKYASNWDKWNEFEMQHGNEDTFREMLRVKRSVSASSYSQTHNILLPELLMQTLGEAKDMLKQAGVDGDQMAGIERQLEANVNEAGTRDKSRVVGFVSAGVGAQKKSTANNEDIELPDSEGEEDDEGNVEIAEKDIPEAVFGGLVRKRVESEIDNGGDGSDSHVGALERIKRRRQAS